MVGGRAGASEKDKQATGDKYQPGQGETGTKGGEKWFPSFSYDETRKMIINDDNPQYHLSHPAFWKPNEKLQTWRPGEGVQLHDMDLLRLRIYQEIYGYLLAALSAGIVCGWPENGVGQNTDWERLNPLHRACALLGAQISLIAAKADGVHAKVVKRHLGMAHSAFSPDDMKEMAKLQQMEEKTATRLKTGKEQERDNGRGGRFRGGGGGHPWPGRGQQERQDDTGGRGGKRQDLSKVVCYACGTKGHLAKQCPQATKTKDNQKASLLRAMEQLSAGAVQPPDKH